MEPWLIHIADYLLAQSWQIAVLTLAVALASFLLRNRSAHVRYLLWLIVLAKALVPPLYTIPIAVLPQHEPPASVLAPPTAEKTVAESESVSRASRPRISGRMPATRSATSPALSMKPAKYDIRAWLAVVWLVGFVIMALYYLLNALRTQVWLQKRRKALPSESASRIESFFTANGVRRMPRVWLLERINQPFVWGLVRGSIYLPAKLLDDKHAKFQPSLLGHELSHVMRLDAMINSLQVIAQTAFWFHPFVWWANRKIRSEREKCCDEMTIALLNAVPEEYGEAIVETLAAKYEQARPVPSLAVAGQVKNIEERINTMLKPGKKFYRRPTLMAVTAALLVAVCAVSTTLVLTARAGTKPEAKSLHEAAIAGDVEQVKLLISNGADVNAKDNEGMTPLHEAAYYGQREVAKVLIAKGANVNATDASGQTPLHLAARFGDSGVLELLIAAGANVNAKDNRGETPLYAARGKLKNIEFLLAKGADVNARNNRGETPLHVAARFRRAIATVDCLLANGANVNAKDNSGDTPLQNAAYIGEKDLVETLVTKGAVIGEKANNGSEALHAAAMGGRYDVVEFLLDKGADINSAQSNGRTALHHAAEAGHDAVAELLIVRGADVNAKSKDGETPLDAAALVGAVKLCDSLIAKGAKVNSLCSAVATGDLAKVESLINENTTPNEKNSALCAAAACGQENVIELLIRKGAHATAKNRRGETALHLAARGGYTDIAKLLLANGADVNASARNRQTPLHYAADRGHKEVVLLLLDNGANVNAGPERWGRAVYYANRSGHEDIAKLLIDRGAKMPSVDLFFSAVSRGQRDLVEFLIKKGADVNMDDRGEWEHPPLLYALWGGRLDILTLLLERGANVNAQDKSGWSLLHYSAGSAVWTKLLLEKGANPNVVEREMGKTPLHIAAEGFRGDGDGEPKDHQAVARLLIAHGADVNAKDWDGKTPLSLAQEKGHIEIADLLRQHGAKE